MASRVVPQCASSVSPLRCAIGRASSAPTTVSTPLARRRRGGGVDRRRCVPARGGGRGRWSRIAVACTERARTRALRPATEVAQLVADLDAYAVAAANAGGTRAYDLLVRARDGAAVRRVLGARRAVRHGADAGDLHAEVGAAHRERVASRRGQRGLRAGGHDGGRSRRRREEGRGEAVDVRRPHEARADRSRRHHADELAVRHRHAAPLRRLEVAAATLVADRHRAERGVVGAKVAAKDFHRVAAAGARVARPRRRSGRAAARRTSAWATATAASPARRGR